MKASQLLLVVSTLLSATGTIAFPSFANGGGLPLEARGGPGRPAPGPAAREIVIPPRPAEPHGLKRIPDRDHPYRAPRKGDKRGPCPGMNTLANHGYIPRDGIATFAQMVTGCVEGFNMGYDLAAAIAAFTVATRGNPLIDLVSMGDESPRVPPLPGRPDGIPGGTGKHGRFENDASIAHEDFYAGGDPSKFSPRMWKKLEGFVAQHSDGKVINLKAMQEMKYWNFLNSQATNPKFVLSPLRLALAYNEAAFVLRFFANGTDGIVTLDMARSFFEKGKFPDNWYRSPTPLGFIDIITENGKIVAPHPLSPGRNAPNGTFVLDDPATLVPGVCGVYKGLLGEVPAVLNQATGALKRNMDLYMKIMHNLFSDCTREPPSGPSEA